MNYHNVVNNEEENSHSLSKTMINHHHTNAFGDVFGDNSAAIDGVFYLSSDAKTGAGDVIPLSKILGDTFDEIPTSNQRRSKRESKKDGQKRSRKGQSKVVDVVDMLPAGATAGDDEEEGGENHHQQHHHHSSKGGDKKGKKIRNKTRSIVHYDDDDEDEVDLNAVDITTPLGVDEVLVVPTHRVVPDNNTTILNPTPTKKSKSSKKESSKHSKKETTKSKKSQPTSAIISSSVSSHYEVDNLLGLDWNNTGSNHVVATPSSNTAADNAVKSQSSKPSSSSATTTSSSSSMSGLLWLSLYSDKHMDISYHVSVNTTNQKKLSLHLKTVNHSKEGFNVSAAIKLLPSHPCRQFITALKSTENNLLSAAEDSLEIAGNVVAGKDTKKSLELELLHSFASSFVSFRDVSSGVLVVGCSLMVCVDSLLGPEAYPVQATIKIPVSANFSPLQMDEQSFAAALSKSSSRWASKSVTLSVSCKAKTAFKAIGGLLHAHTVESESTKATSFCCKNDNNDKVFILAKYNSASNNLQVDIKCLAAKNKEDASLTADCIAQSLLTVLVL